MWQKLPLSGKIKKKYLGVYYPPPDSGGQLEAYCGISFCLVRMWYLWWQIVFFFFATEERQKVDKKSQVSKLFTASNRKQLLRWFTNIDCWMQEQQLYLISCLRNILTFFGLICRLPLLSMKKDCSSTKLLFLHVLRYFLMSSIWVNLLHTCIKSL